MSLRVARAEAIGLRARPAVLPRMSFASMEARQCLLVRVESAEGAVGWGECWVNHPSWGIEERRVTLARAFLSRLVGSDVEEPYKALGALARPLFGPCRQAGVLGAFWAAISGVEMALWDLLGRTRGEPVWRLLSGMKAPSRPSFPAYASGIDPLRASEVVAAKKAEGFRAFKVRVGIEGDDARVTLEAARSAAGPEAFLMADFNGRMSVEDAIAFAGALRDLNLAWIEEPVWGDDVEGLAKVRAASPIPIAAGENLFGEENQRRAIERGSVSVLQPDVSKTGGLTSARRVCLAAVSAGIEYSPHYYSNAVGLAATLHMLASLPKPAWLELDANDNPLRTSLLARPFRFEDGGLFVPDGPGLGVEPDPAAIEAYRVA
ncbi:MAG: mandelate racemase/muconate lactonizing enzyme family protein [Planctomycetota bacterium]